MQAVILAAERGAPLYPLTATLPRSMLPLAAKPLVQYQLELLKRHGIDEAVLCLSAMPEKFESRFGDGRELGMVLRYHREQMPLGTAGAVRSVSDRLVDDSVIVFNGHVLTDADLNGLIDFHRTRDAAVTLLLARVPNPSSFGVVVTDNEGRILSFAEKPAAEETASDTVSAGVYVLRRDILRRIPPHVEYSFERQLFPLLLAEKVPMYGVVNDGRYWRAIASLPDYQAAQTDILERRVDAQIAGNEVREGVWVGEGATVHPTADLRGRIFVNHHTEIEKDARVSGVCSIGSHCRIGQGAVIEDAILWRGTVVEAGAVVRGCILGDHCTVRAGATVQPGSVVGAEGIIASVVARLPSRGDIQRAGIKFGLEGWRGVIADDVTVDNVRLVAQALCDYVRTGAAPGSGIVVGYDRRAQSDVFAREAARVVQANGINPLFSDRPCSSPAVAFACRFYGAAAGIMVTAGNNPPRYGGIKLKAHYGGSATQEMVAQVEEHLRTLLRSGGPPRSAPGDVDGLDLSEPYLANCGRFVDLGRIASAGFKVVVDPMYGSGAGYLARVLGAPSDGGASGVTEIRSEHNPAFGGITPDPVPANMGILFDAVSVSGADLGVSFDGAADRIGASDATGRFVSSHQITALLLKHLREVRGWGGSVVRTVATSRLLDRMAQAYGLPLVETPIGFKYIAETMLKRDVLIGGDETGGVGVKNHLPERDAPLAALLLLEAMAAAGKPLAEMLDDLAREFGRFEYAHTDLHPPQEKMHLIISALQSLKQTGEFAGAALVGIDRTDGARLDFEDGSWLLLRPSGTEPVVRVYAEAATPERAEELLGRGVALVEGV